MADRELKFTVRADGKDAERGFKEVSKAVKQLGTDTDESKSKGQQFAAAMKAVADEIEVELDGARSASDALGSALGDEFKADLEKAGGSVDELVADLRSAGLTYDDVKADAGELADAIRRLGDVGKTAGGDVRAGAAEAEGGLDRVRTASDNSRSVLANMVGNSAQDLGEIGGVAGSAGVALGQMAEYAADGNITLAGFAKTAGPILALTVGVKALSMVMESLGKRSEDVKRQTELLIEVQRKLADGSAVDAASALAEEYRGTVVALKNYGLTAEDLVAHMRGEKDITGQLTAELGKHVEAQIGSQTVYDDTGEEIERLITNLGEARESYDKASEEIKVQDQLSREFTGALGGLTEEQQANYDATVEATQAIFDQVQADIEAIAAKKDQIEASQKARRRQDELNDATKRGEDALNRYRGELDLLYGRLSNDEAYLNLQQNIDDTQQEIVDLWTAEAEGTITHEESTRKQALAWIELKQEAMAYGEQVGLTPTEITTIVDMMGTASVDEVKARIDEITKDRMINVGLNMSGALQGYTVRVTPNGVPERRAHGGPTRAGGLYEVAEGGKSELLHEDGKTFLLAGANGQVEPLSRSSGGGGAGGPVTFQTIIQPGYYGQREMVRMLEARDRDQARRLSYGSRRVE